MKNLVFTLLSLIFNFSIYAQIIYVKPGGTGLKNGSSWANALDGNSPAGDGYTKLADSLRLASSGKQFWIAEGTYKPCSDNDREKYFYILQNISIYGGFAGNETNVNQRNFQLHKSYFSGNIGFDSIDTDNSFHVFATSGATWSLYSTLDGATIIQGYAGNSSYSGNDWRNSGAGVYNGHKLNLANDEFLNCYAANAGGAVYNGKTIDIKNSLFYKNHAASGGGLNIPYSVNPAVLQATVTSCTFSNNSGINGGAICNGGVSQIINCLIVNNSASNGGGVYCGGVIDMNYIRTQIINTTIANNSSDVLFSYGSAKIYNSIIWGSAILTWYNPTLDFKYSCTQSTNSGPGMLHVNPYFLNPTLFSGTSYDGLQADWHLRWCSPLLNMGADSLIPAGITTDINGNPRIQMGTVDMGAYEYDTAGTNPNVVGFANSRIYVSNSNVYTGDGASWSSALAGNAESCIYQGQNLLYEAMKDASAGTEIWIKGGTYKTSLYVNRNHSFTVGHGVKVYGGFVGNETTVGQRNIQMNKTVFSGNIADTLVDTDNSYHVMNINPDGLSYADSAFVDGVTIEKGYANALDGAGILVNANTKVRFNNLEVKNNTTQGNGAGVRINSGARVSIANSSIDHNTGCGMYNQGKLALSNCTVKRNNFLTGVSGIYNADSLVMNGCSIDSNYNDSHASAGGGLVNAGYCKITGCTVKGNRTYLQGGGIWNKSGSGLFISGCNISGNASPSGGGLSNAAGTSCTISQATIANNTDGGGVTNAGLLNMDRCLVSNNKTTGSGGGIYNPTIVKNCIVVNNTKINGNKTGGGIWIGTGCQGVFNSTIMNNSGEGISSGTYDGMLHLILNPDTFLIKNTIVYGNDIQISGHYNISNSCIAGTTTTNTNTWKNPHCVNPTSGKGIDYNGLTANWNLLGCSPCINKGGNAFLTTGDTLDAAGNPRLQFNVVDMGALELQTPAFGGDCPPGISHNILWEIFEPKPANVQTATGAPSQSIYLPALETDFSGDLSAVSRLRGYLIPPRSGYYKFYLAADPFASFYLSTDSTETKIRIIRSTGNTGNYSWPSIPVITDSVNLIIGKPYYFESFCTNYLKIGWVLPGSPALQVISAGDVRQANPKQSTGVHWEIFKNRTTCNFNTLKTTNEIPDEVDRLDSIITIDHVTSLDRFSSRIRGYLIPPATGIYSFYFACDNVGQFWLSPDTLSANAQLKSEIVAMQPDWTQNISTQALVAGQKYYFEILHYDSVYTDLIKLGWKIPGSTLPVVIKTPYIMNCGRDIAPGSFSLFEHKILAFSNWTIPIHYYLTPWNTSYKNIKWTSSNDAIAAVDAEGVIHAVSPGTCQITGKILNDTTLADILTLTVENYNMPFFVKPAVSGNGDGQSWNNAIDLATLTGFLIQGTLQQRVTIYAAEGTYKPTATIDRNKTFTLNNTRLVGGFSGASAGIDTTSRDFANHETILSGDIGVPGDSYENSYHVVTVPVSGSLDGVTIRDGRASCSSYGSTPGVSYYKGDDNGGGVLASTNTCISNCKIINNSAWNRGGGIYCQTGTLTLQNTKFQENKIQQVLISTGGMFFLQINGNGAGIAVRTCNLNISDCLFTNNNSGPNTNYTETIYISLSAVANIDRCSFYNNSVAYDMTSRDGGINNITNSTVKGALSSFNASIFAKKTTIIGNVAVQSPYGHKTTFDNSIITGYNTAGLADTNILVKYCILGSSLFGVNKNDLLSNSLPNSTTWLDTIANNGGITPTAKLKNVSANPAKNNGNSVYLGSTDQRGAVRADSVSIGAYQWVRPTGITITPQHVTLCPGDSAGIAVTVSPALVSESGYTITSLYDSVAHVSDRRIHAASPGYNDIIVRTVDGGLKDTCSVAVMGPCQASVANDTVLSGQNKCYSATQTITVAGNNANFTVLNGGSAILAAGQKISLLPGTTVASGGYLWGYIAPDGPFCQAPQMGYTVLGEDKVPLKIGQTTFMIYPNPTTDRFVLSFKGKSLPGSTAVEIYGVWGNLLISENISGEREHSFSLLNKPAGVYFIRVMSDDMSGTVKIIKQ